MLVRSLKNAGYVEGKTFFAAAFDWRMAAAPVDGVNDGKLSLVTAPGITRGTYEYAINYVGYWLDQAVQANPGLEYVDVVTHSTGGILARAYIQSPAYGGAYVDGNGVKRHLPKIRYLILGACAHFGTIHSYRPWTGDFEDVLSGFIPTTEIEARITATVFAYVIAGGTVTGPDYSITLPELLKTDLNGQIRPDPNTFFRLYDPMRQSLMVTTDFLTPSGGGSPTNVNSDPTLRSNVILDLNANTSPGSNPWALLVGIPGPPKVGGVINTFATGARQRADVLDFVVPARVNQNDYVCTASGIVQLPAGEGSYLPLTGLLTLNPVLSPVSQALFPQVGNTETDPPLNGDENAFFASYEGNVYMDPNITRIQWGNGPVPTTDPGVGSSTGACNTAPTWPMPPSMPWTYRTDYPVYHDVFFYNPDVRKFVVKTLTGETLASEPVITASELAELLLYLEGIL
jgi:hypothetical protein